MSAYGLYRRLRSARGAPNGAQEFFAFPVYARIASMIRPLTIFMSFLYVTTSVAEDSTIFTERQFGFPDGLMKAVILSYDDGPSQDARLIDLLNECGLKGTFYINSGRLGLEAEWMTELIGDPGWYVKAEELDDLYAGHEIGSHTVSHPHLFELDLLRIQLEVTRDIDVLEDLGLARVESFSYPFGEFDDRIVAALSSTGITNARTVESTAGFDVPDDFLRWHPTAHHTQALALVDEFLAMNNDTPALFMIWGHSWEFDGNTPDNHWGIAESICSKLSGRGDIWYVGAGEFVRYINAVKSLHNADGEWVNESQVSVWIRVVGELRELAPH